MLGNLTYPLTICISLGQNMALLTQALHKFIGVSPKLAFNILVSSRMFIVQLLYEENTLNVPRSFVKTVKQDIVLTGQYLPYH